MAHVATAIRTSEPIAAMANQSGASFSSKVSAVMALAGGFGLAVSRPPGVRCGSPGFRFVSFRGESFTSEKTTNTMIPTTISSTQSWWRSRWPVIVEIVVNGRRPTLAAARSSGITITAPATIHTK